MTARANRAAALTSGPSRSRRVPWRPALCGSRRIRPGHQGRLTRRGESADFRAEGPVSAPRTQGPTRNLDSSPTERLGTNSGAIWRVWWASWRVMDAGWPVRAVRRGPGRDTGAAPPLERRGRRGDPPQNDPGGRTGGFPSRSAETGGPGGSRRSAGGRTRPMPATRARAAAGNRPRAGCRRPRNPAEVPAAIPPATSPASARCARAARRRRP